MAEDILSQEEVDALLRGVAAEQVERTEADAAFGVRSYDIGRQERIVRGRMPTLEFVNERFARGLRGALTDLMERGAEVSVGPVRLLKYSEFTRELGVPSNLNLVRLNPLHGMGVMVFERDLVFQVVDNLFGGQGRFQSRVEGRDFTPTEMRIILRMLNLAFDEYQKAWQPVFGLSLEYVRSEISAQFAPIAAPAEVVVVTTLSIDFGLGVGDFHVCVPYAMLDPIRHIIYSNVETERGATDAQWLASLTAQVYRADVEVAATLAHATVTIGQLMALQRGDVVSLDLPEVITADVDGRPVLECRYGVINGQYALKVERVLSREQDGGQ